MSKPDLARENLSLDYDSSNSDVVCGRNVLNLQINLIWMGEQEEEQDFASDGDNDSNKGDPWDDYGDEKKSNKKRKENAGMSSIQSSFPRKIIVVLNGTIC